jgi:hypothetical protein
VSHHEADQISNEVEVVGCTDHLATLSLNAERNGLGIETNGNGERMLWMLMA